MERAGKFQVRPKTLKRIEAGHQAILDDLKPTKAQLERGLALHYNSYVADTQGGVPVNYTGGLLGDRLQKDKKIDRFKAKTFESAFDPQWIEESRALYEIAGVHLALEDVHKGGNIFEAVRWLARTNFVYERRSDLIRVSGFDSIQAGRREGRRCMIQHLAGVGCFAETKDPVANLDLLYALGVRMSQLTYSQKNALCCSCVQENDTGLTPMGKQVVRRMNELGIMVDIPHCGHRTSLEVIEASTEPVIISHTGCRAIYETTDRSRNASDEILRAVANREGLIALYTHGYMLGTGPESFNTWFRHLEHLITVTGGTEHAAIGTDRTFFPNAKPSPMDWTNWPYLTVGLVCRGLADKEIQQIIGENYLRFAERVLDKQPWGTFM